MSPPLLITHELYLAHPPLGPISLYLHPGELDFLVGASGAGKSQLLRVLCDLDPPAQGRVQLAGQPLEELPAPQLRHQIAYLPAQPQLGTATAAQLLQRRQSFRHQPPPEAIDSLWQSLGLKPELWQRPGNRLSTGEALRATLALLLSNRPHVLLLDEPTGALDPNATQRVEGIIQQQAAAGCAVLWVSHDPQQVARLGQQLYYFEGGCLQGPNTDATAFHSIMAPLQDAVPHQEVPA